MTAAPDALAARYRALFETTPDGVMIVDDDGRYVDLNPAMCRMLGGEREALLGRHFVEFMPDELRDLAVAEFAQLQAVGAIALEFPIRRSDGTTLNLQWRSRANFLPGLHVCIARDLSDRDSAQRALEESEERYRAFMAQTSEAIWRFELAEPVPVSLDIDAQIDAWYRVAYLAECNDAFARMYGFGSGEEIAGMPLGEMLVRDEQQNIAYLRAFAENGYQLSGAESREIDREGNEKFFVNSLIGIIENGLLVRVWGTQRDATEEKRLERDRGALLARLELLADVTAVLGASLDEAQTLRSLAQAAVPRFADWCFVDVINAYGEVERVAVRHSDPGMVTLVTEMERRYPTPAEFDIGPPLTIRTGRSQSYDIPDELFSRAAQSEEHLTMLRTLAFHTALVVPLTARGRTLGALSFAQSESKRSFTDDDLRLAEDIGRRAGLALDNARLYGELERANSAKDDFLTMLSHELRTPMTATLGWASMLQRGSVTPEMIATAADAIAQSTRSQARLVEDLLDISRIVAGKMQLNLQPVAMADPLAAAVETLRPAADAKQIRMNVDAADRDLRLYGDPERLQQVFWNLLANAVKFTPRGGRIDVELAREDDAVRVTVRDNGEGIERELLPYIFERFRQGDSSASRRHGGLGLGLSIARNLVELHGGTLRATSAGPGQGAELVALFPITSA